MIKQLINMIPDIWTATVDADRWDSLIVNRRKPYTYRIWTMFGNQRVCLHRFDECLVDEAFQHPHPWPAAFFILEGGYQQDIGYSTDLISQPSQVMSMQLNAGSAYEITSPNTWHRIVPHGQTYTVMLNGEPFSNPHKDVRTTKGKDLDKMDRSDIIASLDKFRFLIEKTFM